MNTDLRAVVQKAEDVLLGQGSFAFDLLASCGEWKREGQDQYLTFCPGCKKQKLSFTTLRTNFARCYVCGTHYGWYTAALHFRLVRDYVEYARLICERAGIPLQLDPDTERRYREEAHRSDILEAALGWMRKQLREAAGAPVLAYLHQRGYTGEEIDGMSLGAYTSRQELQSFLGRGGVKEDEIRKAGLFTTAPEGRGAMGDTHVLAIPVRDSIGRPITLSCRAITDFEPKYLHGSLKDTGIKLSENLFNLHAVRGQELVTLTEGPLDALLLTHHGVPAVACLGASLSKPNLDALIRGGCESLVIALDSDGTGRRATRRTIVDAQAAGLNVHVARLPLKDPDEVIRADGPDAMREYIRYAISAAAWLGIDHVLGVEMDIPTERDRALSRAARTYRQLLQSDPIAAADFAQAVVDHVSLDERGIRIKLAGGAETVDEAVKLRGHVQSIATIIGRQVDEGLKMLRDPQARTPALPTGLGEALDKTLSGGYLDGDLIGWGGRSGGGKSRILIASIFNIAARGRKVGYLSLDMREPRFASYSGSTLAALTKPESGLEPRYLLYPDRRELDIAEGRLWEFKEYGDRFKGSVYAVTDGAKNLPAMQVYADLMFDELGVEILAVDGIYSLDEWHSALEKGQGEQMRVVQCFKALAEGKKRPVIVVSQVKREGYDRPSVASLDYGKALEQLADCVFLFHDEQRMLCELRADGGGVVGYVVDRETGRSRRPRRNKLGNIEPEDLQWVKTATTNPRDIEIIIGKNRGDTGVFVCDFDFVHGCKWEPGPRTAVIQEELYA